MARATQLHLQIPTDPHGAGVAITHLASRPPLLLYNIVSIPSYPAYIIFHFLFFSIRLVFHFRESLNGFRDYGWNMISFQFLKYFLLHGQELLAKTEHDIVTGDLGVTVGQLAV